MKDIIDSLLVDGSFKNLFRAIQAAELIDTLRRPGPFTIFAPEDYAFTDLPEIKTEEFMKDPTKLKALVMYHIIEGDLTLAEISKMESAVTLQGQEVMIDGQRWHLHVNPKINNANIKSADNKVDNGIVHIIDKVLMPNMALTCPVCGAGFITPEVFEDHVKTAHQPKKIDEANPVDEQPSGVQST